MILKIKSEGYGWRYIECNDVFVEENFITPSEDTKSYLDSCGVELTFYTRKEEESKKAIHVRGCQSDSTIVVDSNQDAYVMNGSGDTMFTI